MDLASAWLATRGLVAVALGLQAIELGWLAPIYSASGPWSWSLLGEEFPRSRVLDFFYEGSRLAWLQGISALLLLGSNWAAPLAFLTTLLVALRFRGSLNGGADSMSLVLLSALSVGSVLGHQGFCLGYIAFQCVASYVLAGWCKIRRPPWRSGVAVHQLLHRSAYDVPLVAQKLFSTAAPCLVAAWAVMGFELSFLALPWQHALAPALIAAGLGFHLANFAILGLNRFFWIWAATYPALLYVCH